MECPRCGKNEFSSDGTCLTCNYKIDRTETALERELNEKDTEVTPQESGDESSMDAAILSPQDEIPQWQKELSLRLEGIKQKKEKHDDPVQTQSAGAPATESAEPVKTSELQFQTPMEHAGTILVRRQNSEEPPSTGDADSTPPQQKTIASLGPDVYTGGKTAKTSTLENIKELIDDTVSRLPAQSKKEPPGSEPKSPAADENKFILLSRTLAGLIDLIIVVLCTTAFVISADYFSGIVILDILSLAEYAGLFLMVFLLYSIFFLATSGQTVGMMITDLQVTGPQGTRPSIGQLFIRCFGFLLSVVVFGAGLLWSLLDRENMCFHDRFSNTSVTRI